MQQYVECKRENYTLRGTAHIPEGADKDHRVPLVIISHGFTADRNENLFIHKRLSLRLLEAGIGSLRFDFMGSGESDGTFGEMSVKTEIEDLLTIFAYAKTLDWVDSGRIALHGMSMGGLVSCSVAGRLKEQIRALSLWAPALCIHEMCQQGELLGYSTEGIYERGYMDYRGDRLGVCYLKDAIEEDTASVLQQYEGPVSIVHGTSDTSVDFSGSVDILQMLGPEHCTLHPVEGADHDFATLSYNEQRLCYAVDFLREQLFERR